MPKSIRIASFNRRLVERILSPLCHDSRPSFCSQYRRRAGTGMQMKGLEYGLKQDSKITRKSEKKWKDGVEDVARWLNLIAVALYQLFSTKRNIVKWTEYSANRQELLRGITVMIHLHKLFRDNIGNRLLTLLFYGSKTVAWNHFLRNRATDRAVLVLEVFPRIFYIIVQLRTGSSPNFVTLSESLGTGKRWRFTVRRRWCIHVSVAHVVRTVENCVLSFVNWKLD